MGMPTTMMPPDYDFPYDPNFPGDGTTMMPPDYYDMPDYDESMPAGMAFQSMSGSGTEAKNGSDSLFSGSNQPGSGSESSRSDGALLVGISVGAACLIVLLLAVCLVRRRRNTNSSRDDLAAAMRSEAAKQDLQRVSGGSDPVLRDDIEKAVIVR